MAIYPFLGLRLKTFQGCFVGIHFSGYIFALQRVWSVWWLCRRGCRRPGHMVGVSLSLWWREESGHRVSFCHQLPCTIKTTVLYMGAFWMYGCMPEYRTCPSLKNVTFRAIQPWVFHADNKVYLPTQHVLGLQLKQRGSNFVSCFDIVGSSVGAGREEMRAETYTSG